MGQGKGSPDYLYTSSSNQTVSLSEANPIKEKIHRKLCVIIAQNKSGFQTLAAGASGEINLNTGANPAEQTSYSNYLAEHAPSAFIVA
jgi:hypothetical protein